MPERLKHGTWGFGTPWPSTRASCVSASRSPRRRRGRGMSRWRAARRRWRGAPDRAQRGAHRVGPDASRRTDARQRCLPSIRRRDLGPGDDLFEHRAVHDVLRRCVLESDSSGGLRLLDRRSRCDRRRKSGRAVTATVRPWTARGRGHRPGAGARSHRCAPPVLAALVTLIRASFRDRGETRANRYGMVEIRAGAFVCLVRSCGGGGSHVVQGRDTAYARA